MGPPRATFLALLLAAAPILAAAQPAVSRIELEDGQVLLGRVVAREDDWLELELGDGRRLRLPAPSVRRVEPAPSHRVVRGQLEARDAFRSRHLFAPSAVMLDPGEAWISQKEVVATTGQVGVTRWLTLGAGAILPWYFSGEEGLNGWLMVQAGAPVGEHLRLAVQAQTYHLPIVRPMAMASVVATVEGERWQASAAVGQLWGLSRAWSPTAWRPVEGDFAAILAGSHRLSPRFSLVAEGWLLTGAARWALLGGAACRIHASPFTVDLGVLAIPSTRVPIPWLELGYTL